MKAPINSSVVVFDCVTRKREATIHDIEVDTKLSRTTIEIAVVRLSRDGLVKTRTNPSGTLFVRVAAMADDDAARKRSKSGSGQFGGAPYQIAFTPLVTRRDIPGVTRPVIHAPGCVVVSRYDGSLKNGGGS